jgi:hypothetical protein
MTFLNRLYGGHFPITLSLGIIVGVIGVSVVLSLLFPKKGAAKPRAGEEDTDAGEEPDEKQG